MLTDDGIAVRRTADRILEKNDSGEWRCPVCGADMIMRYGLKEKRIYCRGCRKANLLLWLTAYKNGHVHPVRADYTELFQGALDAGIVPCYRGYRDEDSNI